MTPKTLFTIILKVVGILFIKELLVSITQLVVQILAMIKREVSTEEPLLSIAFVMLPIMAYFLIAWLFLFKTDDFITKLRLDKGLGEEALALNISTNTVLNIALVATGAYILAMGIPELVKDAIAFFQYYRVSRMAYAADGINPLVSNFFLPVTRIVMGVLVIIERKRIVSFIEKRERKAEEDTQSQ